MKRTSLLLFTVLIVILTSAVISSVFVNAENNNVVYISSNGTGDGSSPDSPLGNATGYKPGNKMEIYNAFYIGLDKLKKTGGTLVVVGEVTLDSVESRFPSTKEEVLAPSEFSAPSFEKNVSLTVTSVYNGVDYRKNGAKLILDHDTCNTTAFMFKCDTLIDEIDIEYKYDEDFPNSWNTSFMLGGNGYNFTIGENVNVTSFNTKTNQAGNRFPILLGGHRYANLKNSTNITVKSGTWDTVIAGSFGVDNSTYGNIDGDANVVINGGKIGTLIGTGSLERPITTIKGNVNIIVTKGEIGKLYAATSCEYNGSGIKINLGKDAIIGSFHYAPENYSGNIDTLIKNTHILNASNLKIDVPQIQTPTPQTQPVSTKAPETIPAETAPAETTAATTEQPTETTLQETTPETLPSKNNSEKGIGKTVLIILIIAAVVVGIFSFVINRIKLNMLK